MSRRRYLSTDISTDTAVNRLAMKSDFAALLYTWMIPHCGDDASIPADAEEILLLVMPGRRDKTVADIEDALQLIHEAGLIEWRQDEKTVNYPVPAFYKYQTYITGGRRKVAHNSDQQRGSDNCGDNAADQRTTPQNAASLKSSSSVSLKSSSSVSPSGGEPSRERATPPPPKPTIELAQPPGTPRIAEDQAVRDKRHAVFDAYCAALGIKPDSPEWHKRWHLSWGELTPEILGAITPERMSELTTFLSRQRRARGFRHVPKIELVLQVESEFDGWVASGRPETAFEPQQRPNGRASPGVRSAQNGRTGYTLAELQRIAEGGDDEQARNHQDPHDASFRVVQ